MLTDTMHDRFCNSLAKLIAICARQKAADGTANCYVDGRRVLRFNTFNRSEQTEAMAALIEWYDPFMHL